ncbi:IS5 family transposase [Saccharothrix yanglingensis]|uniref:IS5 family transposase n=1 Tax=Saccharothrix yanglingensis TaxID=659496 RepID=UPI0027D345CF|nr:IS5 family transposase [Saccharothrix yanglingensis]
MARRRPWEVEDELWERIEPLSPVVSRRPRNPGRKRLPDRQVLCGILFVLHTGIQWEFLPRELGFGSGMTCWRRLAEWNEAGVWRRLHELLLAELHSAGALDWDRAVVDSSHVRATPDAAQSGPSPVDRARPGSKHHLLTEGGGIPLAVLLTGGNRNDVIGLEPLLDAVPSVGGRRGRPRRRPKTVYADRAHDHDKYRRCLRARGIATRIARCGEPHGSGLGVVRWVVERTIAWYHGMKRPRIRWERRDDIHEAFLGLATCIICYRHVRRFC